MLRQFESRSGFLSAAGVIFGLVTLGCGGTGVDDHSSIVLITIDTLRADHLSSYGYIRETSPTIDALALEGVLFENTITTMATTLPAHASLMTSTWTTTHGLKGNFTHLGVVFDEQGRLRTMAEMLSGLGYDTAAFVSATPVGDHTGLQRGFAVFDQPESEERRADATVEKAISWLEANSARPMFLWVHLFDPHGPRRPPAPYDRAFKVDETLIEFLKPRNVSTTRRHLIRRQINAYDGEILFADSQIARLFGVLKTRGEWRDTAVVVTADHGEGLGQHDWMGHGKIFNEQLRVPLIMKFPRGRGPHGVRISSVASLVDVLPTLVESLELPLSEPEQMQLEGVDLLSKEISRPGVFSEQVHRSRMRETGLRFSLTSSDWKYFHRPEAEDELYDLVGDPFETENIIESHPTVANRMRQEILSWLADAAEPQRGSVEPELDEAVKQQLQALGYLGGGSEEKGARAWQGVAIWGHEVREFRHCGADEAVWVIDETGEMWNQYRKLDVDSEPYTEMFVEVLGQLGAPPTEGFGTEYPGSIRVMEVMSMVAGGTGCEED